MIAEKKIPAVLVAGIMRRESTGEERPVTVELPLAAYLRGVLKAPREVVRA